MSLSKSSVKRGVTVVMAYIAVTIFSVIALIKLPIDLMPEFEMPAISVITIYPGAGASDVEDKLSKPIEENLSLVANLKKINSISKDNMSVVSCIFDFGTNLAEAANDIRARLDMAKRLLPADAEPPIILKFDSTMMPIIFFSVRSDQGSAAEIREMVRKRVADPLQRIKGVGAIQIFNSADARIFVEADRKKMVHAGISLTQIEKALSMANLSMPAGRIKIGNFDYPVRVPGKFRSLKDILRVIVGQHQGKPIYLSDVARVRRGFEEALQLSKGTRRDDKTKKWGPVNSSLFLMVQKQSGANTLTVAKELEKKLGLIEKTLPPQLKVDILLDTSEFISRIVSNLKDTVVVAAFLVILVVLIFIRRLRASLVITLTLPASVVVAFLVMYAFGLTINTATLMALALAIGMVVDNAIVVLEVIVRHIEQGKSVLRAAVDGAAEVGQAVTASTLTTVAIFGPLAFLGGFVGIMGKSVSIVVCGTLIASLITALVLTPLLASRLIKAPNKNRRSLANRLYAFTEKPFNWLTSGYGAVLRFALNRRWVIVLAAISIAAGTVYLVKRTGLAYMMESDVGFVQMIVELRPGTRLGSTAKVAEKIIRYVQKMPESRLAFYQVGASETGGETTMGGKEGPNVASIMIRLVPVKDRKRSDRDIAALLRRFAQNLPEIRSFDLKVGNPINRISQGLGKPITLEILGEDYDELRKTALAVKNLLSSIKGTLDVSLDLFEEKTELNLDINRLRASRMGIPLALLGLSLRTALYGKKIGKFRADKEDLDIYLRVRKEDRTTIHDLEWLHVPSMSGMMKPIRNLGRFREKKALVEIRRQDKRRVLSVGANFKGRALGDIGMDLKRGLAKLNTPRSVTVQFAGNLERQEEDFRDLFIALILGILLVYMVMAGQFESFLDPFVIMFSIPFAFTGCFLLLLLVGENLSMNAFLGLVILMGIVVNNGIVLLDYVNQLRLKGMAMKEAILEAGKKRLRPVLMTAFTTIAGMLPMAMMTAEGAEMWRPMALAVIGGLLMSTIITLVFVPVMYTFFERFRRIGKRQKMLEELKD